MATAWPLLVTAIPLGIYNFTEAINNVESVAAGAILGSLLGSHVPPAVYVGHLGWKAMGGCIGLSLATGVGVMCFLGLTALLLSIIPLVAIVPILLFFGMVIGALAFQACPARHVPAIVLAGLMLA